MQVDWYWVLLAALAGMFAGMFIAALCNAAGRMSREEENAELRQELKNRVCLPE